MIKTERNRPDVNGTTGDLRIIKRIFWVAQPPSGPRNNLTLPVHAVIIHHTDTESCDTKGACILQTRTIQTYDIESRSLNDIAYNFLIGGDGAVYEGRGWKVEGAHTLGANDKSFGVAFIGTFSKELPPKIMVTVFYKLVDIAIQKGYLTKNYKIMAARQFSGIESPGKAFYELIKSWPQWSEKL
uniref:Peptidoglycan-recognition protein LF-like n=1 Tax=Diabrotica virgifera virgifera TaxID=50390 RepID=A0A6P7F6G3_DIAVI